VRLLETLAFKLMAFWFRLRDRITPPEAILDELDIQEGFRVLDYGCGPGSFTLLAARRVGPSGKVYAVDINPLALQHVQKAAVEKGLGNIEVIRTDCATGLESESVDLVLLYDAYHELENPASVLEELHRVLKPQGLLSFSDHHMREEDILQEVTGGGRFRLVAKGKRTYTFAKVG
jgi:ubiquinone/menaquinone biosynthesis C-methylase UbiE